MAAHKVSVRKISPLSVFRTMLAISLVAFAAWILFVIIVYFCLDAAGVVGKINGIIGNAGGKGILDFGNVIVAAALIGAIWSLLVTILSPIGALIYNSTSALFKGVVVTLHDEIR